MVTVLINFFFFANQAIHPNTIVIVENNAFVLRVFNSVLLQDMRAFLILPELEQILD